MRAADSPLSSLGSPLTRHSLGGLRKKAKLGNGFRLRKYRQIVKSSATRPS